VLAGTGPLTSLVTMAALAPVGRDGAKERTLPKYLLLKNYRGGPENHPDFTLFDDWDSAEFAAHMAFQTHVIELLTERGELVDVQALSSAGTYVRYGGPDKAPVTDGPFPESKELVAGYFLVDVGSEERAREIAAWISSAPGPHGRPLHEWIEVRPLMSGSTDAVE